MVNQTIVTIYENYLEEMSAAAAAEARHLGGLSRLLTGKQGGSEVLLTAFDSKLAAELNGLLEQKPESAEIRELGEWMLEQLAAYQSNPPVKYSFMAVQRHLIPLVEGLSGGDAEVLFKKFETAVPKRERFPIYTELLSKLKEQSKK